METIEAGLIFQTGEFLAATPYVVLIPVAAKIGWVAGSWINERWVEPWLWDEQNSDDERETCETPREGRKKPIDRNKEIDPEGGPPKIRPPYIPGVREVTDPPPKRPDIPKDAPKSTLHTRGFKPPPGTRVRPQGVPEHWKAKPTKGKGGVTWYDPKNPHNNVRVMPGDPKSPYPNSQKPYVRDVRNGQHVDSSGNMVDKYAPGGHQPLDTYEYK